MSDGPDDGLGAALRRFRDRLDPAAVGLPAGRVRRAPGLRREEVALLAGVSVDYVVRLEQGRATAPSAQVVTALARALRLSEPERRHLFRLAGQVPPDAGRMTARLTPGVRRLLDQLTGPVGVYDAAWTLIAWNPLYAALHGDPSGWPERERNVLWRHFTGGPHRVRHTPEQEARFEAAAVADLRGAGARYPADAGLRSLIAALRAASDRFSRLWDSHAVGSHTMDTKSVHHPDVGPLTLDCDVLGVPDSDLHVVLCTAAPGSEAAAKLALLSGTAHPGHPAPAGHRSRTLVSVPRDPKKPRRLVADGRAYLWTLRHSHRVLDSGRAADCCQTLTLYPQPPGTGGPLRIVFADGPGRYVPGGFPLGSGDVGYVRGGSLNLHEPGAVRALLDAASARGWQPGERRAVELDGWPLLEAAAAARTGDAASGGE